MTKQRSTLQAAASAAVCASHTRVSSSAIFWRISASEDLGTATRMTEMLTTIASEITNTKLRIADSNSNRLLPMQTDPAARRNRAIYPIRTAAHRAEASQRQCGNAPAVLSALPNAKCDLCFHAARDSTKLWWRFSGEQARQSTAPGPPRSDSQISSRDRH